MQESRKFPKKAENAPSSCRYEFGPFTLNPQKRMVFRDNAPVALTPKCFDVLLVLVEHAGEVLVKEQVMEAVWQDTAVEEGNLNRHISTLRKTLGESPNDHRYVVTVPGRGYQFVAEVRAVFDPVATTIRHDSKGRSDGLDLAADHHSDHQAREIGLRSVSSAPVLVPIPAAAARGLRKWHLWTAAAVVVCVLGGGLLYALAFRPKHVLAANDRILIGDFTNSTGDLVFDGTLKQALSVDLSQSPYLNIISDARVSGTLKLMTRPADTPLTGEVAQEACQRTGGKAYITGSIVRLDTQYVVGLDAVDCRTGDSIAREQVKAGSKDGVLNALDRAGITLRQKLGESLQTVQEFDTPLVEATTASLEALKAYSVGLHKGELNDATPIPFLKRAIELDPDFASAYSALAVCYFNMGESGLAIENFSKAFELRGHVSEREKLLISARYYNYVTGELPKAIETFQLWIQAYPRDAGAHGNLGSLYGATAQYEKSIEATLVALRLDPDGGANYSNLIIAQAALDRLDAAAKTFQMAMARGLEDAILRVNWFGVAFVRGDVQEMDKQMAWSTAKPEAEDNFLAAKSDAEGYYGHLAKARDFSRRAVDSALRNDEKEAAAKWKMDQALREAEFGNFEVALKDTAAARVLTASHDTQILAALAWARTGHTADAVKLADDLQKRYPLDTLVNNYWLPVIRANVELDRRHPDRAIEILEAAMPYEMASPVTWPGLGGPYYPAYLRGAAYLQLHRGSEGAAEYQKIADHAGFMLACPLGALAHLGVARSYALNGDYAKARAAYKDFFALWREADADIPILNQAKAELAKLQ
jgi:DNA-binding winged helix-turn-helix (wHTH) protein/tetratricopeptide (TPR) repeat protein